MNKTKMFRRGSVMCRLSERPASDWLEDEAVVAFIVDTGDWFGCADDARELSYCGAQSATSFLPGSGIRSLGTVLGEHSSSEYSTV